MVGNVIFTCSLLILVPMQASTTAFAWGEPGNEAIVPSFLRHFATDFVAKFFRNERSVIVCVSGVAH